MPKNLCNHKLSVVCRHPWTVFLATGMIIETSYLACTCTKNLIHVYEILGQYNFFVNASHFSIFLYSGLCFGQHQFWATLCLLRHFWIHFFRFQECELLWDLCLIHWSCMVCRHLCYIYLPICQMNSAGPWEPIFNENY